MNHTKEIRTIINKRLKEFENLGKYGVTYFNFKPFVNIELQATIETELLFCVSVANSSALSGIKFQKYLENINLNNLTLDKIEYFLKISGVRFYKRKAIYIKNLIDNDFAILKEILKLDSYSARNLLLKIKGIGMKEAGHFLRNIGRKDVAIIDRHILRWLKQNKYISEIPNSLTKKKYLEIEEILKKIAKKKNISLAQLDLEIWYEMTGKVLK